MDFEVFGILLALAFVVLPFPLCIFLLVRQRKLSERIWRLETQMGGLHHEAPVAGSTLESSVRVSGAACPVSMGHAQVGRVEASVTAGSVDSPAVHSEKRSIPDVSTASFSQPTVSPSVIQEGIRQSTLEPSDASGLAHRLDAGSGQYGKSSPGKRNIADFLRSVGMLPPDKGIGIESGWIQWVAPRLGGVFAVMAILFFGVYVAQNAKPWVRFLEAFVVSGAVFGCGLWMRRRNPGYGSILSTIGLGMIYTTVIAGYAAPAIRVIESPWVGMFTQMSLVVLSSWLAMRWANRGMVLFSMLLGIGTSVFSAWVGLQEAALVAGGLVFATGFVFAVRWDWKPCLIFALAGSSSPIWTWVLQDALAMVKELPFEVAVMGYLISIAVACASLLFVEKATRLRAFVSSGSLSSVSGAILLVSGYAWFRWVIQGLEDFYGAMACSYLLIAVVFFRREDARGAFTVYAIKASFLVTLWAVLALNTEARWLFVAIQGTSLAFLARRRKSIWIEAISAGTFAYATLWMLRAMPLNLPLGMLRSWLYLGYGWLGLGTLGWLQGGMPADDRRKGVYCVLAVCVVCVTFYLIRNSGLEVAWQIRLLLLVGVLSAFLSYIPGMKRWALFVGFGLLLVLSAILFWAFPQHVPGGAAVVAVCAGTIAVCRLYKGSMSNWQQVRAEWVLNGLAVVSSQLMMLQILAEPWHAIWASSFALSLALLSLCRFRALSDWIFLPLVLFGFNDPGTHVAVWQNVMIPGMLLILLAWTVWFHPRRIRTFQLFRRYRLWTLVLSLTWIIWWNWLGSVLPIWLHFVVWSIAGAVLMLPVLRWRRVPWAVAGWTLAQLVVWGIVIIQWVSADYQGVNTPVRNVSFLWAAAMVSAMTCVSIFCLVRWKRIGVGPFMRQALIWFHSILLVGGSMLWIGYRPLEWNTYYTPLWAMIAFSGVIGGVFMNCRPLRIVSLTGLLLPITRLFVYDVTQTLHRIIAFAALSVLLLVLGYIYQKIRPYDHVAGEQ